MQLLFSNHTGLLSDKPNSRCPTTADFVSSIWNLPLGPRGSQALLLNPKLWFNGNEARPTTSIFFEVPEGDIEEQSLVYYSRKVES